MKRVISYIRFSSEKQAKGDSLRRQSKMVTDWLALILSTTLTKIYPSVI